MTAATCAGTKERQRTAAIAGMTSVFARGAHAAYAEEAIRRGDACVASGNTAPDQLDLCLGHGYTTKDQEKVSIALLAFRGATQAVKAAAHAGDQEARVAALLEVRKTALELIHALPDDSELVAELQKQLKTLGLE